MNQPIQIPAWKALSLFVGVLALGLAVQPMEASAQAPGVKLLATDPSALAGTSSGTFTLIRYGDTNLSLTVNLNIAGTASNGVDYAAVDSSLTLDPGVLALDVLVQPSVNPANRGNKTVVLTVQSNAAYTVYGTPSATVKIVDDLYDVPPPTVTITSPGDGSVFTRPTAITLTADVSDPNLPIQGVSFYANDNFLGRVTNSPYTLVWTNAHAGKYAIFSRATDTFGKSAVSSPVDITVSDVPVVTLSPVDGSTVVILGQQIGLQAQVGDPNETIKSVSFYVGGTL
ncbi:MAG: hypothetical protein JWQ04_65, partial [Pedosphaera sp.]|nr:hypothetical protein [Pedosphaera sp.]